MARRFIDDILADIDGQMPDNSSGLITPAIMRQLMKDMCDSLKQDEASLTRTATTPVEDVPVTTSFTVLGAGIYDTAEGADGTFLITDLAAGQIQTAVEAGWSYEGVAAVSFIGPSNREFEFSISRNGVETIYVAQVAGEGNNNPVSVLLRSIVGNQSGDRLGVSVRADANTDIDILDIGFGLIILPTNTP